MSTNDMMFMENKFLSSTEYAEKALQHHKTKNAPDDPFLVCCLDEVKENYGRWKKHLPSVEMFYAVKSNDDPRVLRLLASLGANFDCSSKNEIERVLSIGVSATRIIYATTVKQMSHITYAKTQGVNLMTFDNIEELDKIKRLHPTCGLIIRFKTQPDVDCLINLSPKFGCDLSEVKTLIQAVKERDLTLVGISFHVGTDCREERPFLKSIEDARRVYDLASDFGFKMEIVDIGGGFPASNFSSLFERMTSSVNVALGKHFGDKDVRVIAEPGRFVVASCETLMTCVIGKRAIANTKNDEPSYMYYLNDGVHGSLYAFHKMYKKLHTSSDDIQVVGSKKDEKLYTCSLWGPTNDSLDLICREWRLPCLNIGDWICFKNNGSYCEALSKNFNRMPKPSKFYFSSIEENFKNDTQH